MVAGLIFSVWQAIILLMIKKEEKILIENRNPKSLMAFGAMGAHLNMALQALKATESDQ